MQRYNKLLFEIILKEIFIKFDPLFVVNVFPHISNHSFYWENKINKHFPGYSTKDPFNQDTFQKIENERYVKFSTAEKELLRLIVEKDAEGLQKSKLDISLETFNKEDKNNESILFKVENINYAPVTDWVYKTGFSAAEKYYTKENGELDYKKSDYLGRTLLYWGFIFQQSSETLLQLMKHGSFAELYLNELQPFHLAIKLGRLDFIEAIFTDPTFSDHLGSLLEQTNVLGETPLILAAQKGCLKIVEFLLNKNANHATFTDNPTYEHHGRTAFYWAVRSNNLPIVELFIKRFPELLEMQDNVGEVPLIWAATFGHTAIVKYLLDKGAECNVTTNRPNHNLHGTTAFQRAIESGNLETVKYLIQRFPWLTKQENTFGEGPLMWAAALGHTAIVKILLDWGAHPNLRTQRPGHVDHRKTPLYWAVANGHSEIVELLIKAGAIDTEEYDVSLYKVGVMHLAARGGKLGMIKALVETLPNLPYIALANRATFSALTATDNVITDLANLYDQKNSDDETPLFFAAKKGHVEILEYLLAKGANPNICNKSTPFETPLDVAFKSNHMDAVLLLINKGADVTLVAGKGFANTAAKDGKLAILKALIENDPQPPKILESKDMYGQTPLLWGAVGGHREIVTYLLSKGANQNVKSYTATDEQLKKYNGYSPLDWALKENHFKIVADLYKAAHGNIEPKSITRLELQTKLLNFAVQNKDLELIKLLLENNENKNELLRQTNEEGLNPLLSAMGHAHLDIFAYILSQGADPNCLFNEQPPIYWAFVNNEVEMVVNLIKSGAKTKSVFIQIAAAGDDLRMVKAFIKNDPQALSRGDIQQALIEAVKNGKSSIAKYLLKQVDLNGNLIAIHNLSEDYKKEVLKALGTAIANNYDETVTVLVKALNQMVATAKMFREILISRINEAVHQGDVERIQIYLKLVENQEEKIAFLNQEDEKGIPQLLHAVIKRDANLVEYLLSQGANPDVAIPDGHALSADAKTAFELAFKEALRYKGSKITDPDYPDHAVVFKIVVSFIKHHANTQLAKDLYAIHAAIESNDLTLVKILVEMDPRQLEQKNVDGYTALFLAVLKGHVEISKYLLLQAPIQFAANHGEQAFSHQQDNREIAFYNTNDSLIHLAVISKKKEIVKAVLEGQNKLDLINRRNEVGQTPLLLALAIDASDVAEYLLEQGADPNVKDKLGRTALLFALAYNNYYMAEYLLNLGVDPNVKVNWKGYETTAFYIAAALRKDGLVNLILQKGATLITDDKLNIRHNNFPPFYFNSAEMRSSSPQGGINKIKVAATEPTTEKKKPPKPANPFSIFNCRSFKSNRTFQEPEETKKTGLGLTYLKHF